MNFRNTRPGDFVVVSNRLGLSHIETIRRVTDCIETNGSIYEEETLKYDFDGRYINETSYNDFGRRIERMATPEESDAYIADLDRYRANAKIRSIAHDVECLSDRVVYAILETYERERNETASR